MSAQTFYDSLNDYLSITYSIEDVIGNTIGVGETFTLRVRVTNTAPGGKGNPDLRYQNLKVSVKKTEFAAPFQSPSSSNTADKVTVDLNDPYLTRGDSGEAVFKFYAAKAIMAKNDVLPFIWPENFTLISVEANIDYKHIFKVYASLVAQTDIKHD